MIRVAGLVALVALVSLGLGQWEPDSEVAAPRDGEARARHAVPLQLPATSSLLGRVTTHLAQSFSAEGVTSLLAIPEATPMASGDPFEIPGAVPLSLMIQNDGADDRLLGGNTPAAERVEVHHARLIDGRQVMEMAPDGIAIPAGAMLILEPGRSHLMLLGLRISLVQGETFPLTLHFEHAGDVTVTVRVRRRVDAAGVSPVPPTVADGLSVSLVSAPPAPAGTPLAP